MKNSTAIKPDRHPTVVDLFAGIGAMSLGFRRAGAVIELAVERDPIRAASYRMNHKGVEVVERDIDEQFSLNRLLGDRDIARPDIIIGGPPCRGWSSLGTRTTTQRRREQNACTWDFIRLIREAQPRAFLLENVSGLARADGGAILSMILHRLADDGEYSVNFELCRAADYGVPQLRRRLFVVGVHRDLRKAYEFPRPTHSEAQWISVEEAIGDLPSIGQGAAAVEYDRTPFTQYQRRMRGKAKILRLHEAPTATGKVAEILPYLAPGESLRDLPENLRPHTGFHNTYGRLDGSKPASAVTGSIGRISSGRHAHPHQDRALTPREAARLQSLPDSYRIAGFRWEAYRQIGDAVPPLLAEHVARPLISLVKNSERPERVTG